MAVLAIKSTNTDNGGKVNYLVERHWISNNKCYSLVQLFLVIESAIDGVQKYNQIDVIVHGKIKSFEKSLKHFKGLTIPIDLPKQKDILIVSNLYNTNSNFVDAEGWEEGYDSRGTGPKVKIGDLDVNVIPAKELKFNISSNKNYKRCSEINIEWENNFFVPGQNYLISFAFILDIFYQKNPIKKVCLSFKDFILDVKNYEVHFYTTRINDNDNKVLEILARDGSIMPLNFYTKDRKYLTSMVFIIPNKDCLLLNESCDYSKKDRYINPFSHDLLKPNRPAYLFDALKFAYSTEQRESGLIYPCIQNSPLNFDLVNRNFRLQAVPTIFALFLGIYTYFAQDTSGSITFLNFSFRASWIVFLCLLSFAYGSYRIIRKIN